MHTMRNVLLAGTAAAAIVLAACGSSGSHKTTGSTAAAAYCQQLKTTGDAFGDPGIDAIFKDNPNPTLAQWAAFLPAPIAKMRGFIGKVKALRPPADLADEQQAVVDGLTNMANSFDASLAAAKAGDNTKFAAEEARNQDVNGPAMEKAFTALGTACGFSDSARPADAP